MRFIIAALSVLVAFVAILFILDLGNRLTQPTTVSEPSPEPKPANDYPVNRYYEESGKIAYTSKGNVRIIHRVTWDQKDNMYVYFYRLEHVGENTVIVNWQVLDEVFGTKKTPLLVVLKASGDAAAKEFTFKSKNPPRRLDGLISVYGKKDDSNQLWNYDVQVPLSGPVPTDALPSVERPIANGVEML